MSSEKLDEAKDAFINQWGTLGSAWGVNRTQSQIHAALMVSPDPLNTDQLMEQLSISRGNAHASLKDLTGWGLVKSVHIKGDRKEYFETEKEPWKLFCTVAKERRRREVQPALEIINECLENTKSLKGKDADAFNNQLKELSEFVTLASNLLEKLGKSEKSTLIKLMLKMLS